MKKIICLILFASCFARADTYSVSGTWIKPDGVSSCKFDLWSGGNKRTLGSGAHCQRTLDVSGITTLDIVVSSTGPYTSIGDITKCKEAGSNPKNDGSLGQVTISCW